VAVFFFVAELRVRPPGDSFTKPVGGSVVMTCSLEMADGDTADDEVVLSWLDDGGQEVSSVTGRYEVTIPSPHLSFNGCFQANLGQLVPLLLYYLFTCSG